MNRGTAIVGAVSVAMIGAGIIFWMANTAGSDSGVMPKDVDLTAGQTLYAENCASCHGASLEGQENWQSPGEDGRLPAPPHDETGHTWHHADRALVEWILDGVPLATTMPKWRGQLTEQEVVAILAYMKTFWSADNLDQQIRGSIQYEDQVREFGN